MSTTILIADDHPMVRDAFVRAVAAVNPDWRVIQAATLAETRTALLADAPTLALIDLHMPGMHGIDSLLALRAEFPAQPIVVASAQDDAATIRAVLRSGCAGFIPKTEPCDVVQHAIRLVQAGGVYVPRALAAAPAETGQPELTPRQREVLTLLLDGRPNKLIARELGLTEGTVKIHIAAILRALQVRNRTEAVVRARELGFIATPPGGGSALRSSNAMSCA